MTGFLLDTNVPSELKKRTQLQECLDDTLRPWFAGRILPITEPIAERMLIAATALEHNLAVVTRNVKDFAGFGVPIFNPWEA